MRISLVTTTALNAEFFQLIQPMSQKKRFLRLDSILAYRQSESDGDEIFIKYNGEVVAPLESRFIRMSSQPTPLNVEIELPESEKWVELELWDYDHLSPNDCLGKFRLLVDQIEENFAAELIRDNQSEARYVLNWSVIERRRGAT